MIAKGGGGGPATAGTTTAMLLEDLDRYERAWPADDTSMLHRYRHFVECNPECCRRSNLPGHCTGSALISCPRGERVLLLYHPYLRRWLQPGGHADGDTDLWAVARREAHEETGLPLSSLLPYPQPCKGKRMDRVPLDLDIHPIPERKSEPAHFHYDLRFLFIASPELRLVPETPDLPLAWLSREEVSRLTDEESVLRMLRKLAALPRSAEGLLLGVEPLSSHQE